MRMRTQTLARRARQRGVAFIEFAIVVSLFLLLSLVSIDVGRLIYFKQVVAGLAREGGSLASRGATDAQTIAAIESGDAPLDMKNAGRTIVSMIQRKGTTDARPWVITQTTSGSYSFASRVGVVNGLAKIPGITSVAVGTTIRAVEVVHKLSPTTAIPAFGVSLPTFVYEVAYF